MNRDAPIGVFDSGVGGLTVLKALVTQLPRERFVYLGDTARLPYGTKSAETVVRYALQAAEAVADYGVKCLVIACNTASAMGLAAVGVTSLSREGCRAGRAARDRAAAPRAGAPAALGSPRAEVPPVSSRKAPRPRLSC